MYILSTSTIFNATQKLVSLNWSIACFIRWGSVVLKGRCSLCTGWLLKKKTLSYSRFPEIVSTKRSQNFVPIYFQLLVCICHLTLGISDKHMAILNAFPLKVKSCGGNLVSKDHKILSLFLVSGPDHVQKFALCYFLIRVFTFEL